MRCKFWGDFALDKWMSLFSVCTICFSLRFLTFGGGLAPRPWLLKPWIFLVTEQVRWSWEGAHIPEERITIMSILFHSFSNDCNNECEMMSIKRRSMLGGWHPVWSTKGMGQMTMWQQHYQNFFFKAIAKKLKKDDWRLTHCWQSRLFATNLVCADGYSLDNQQHINTTIQHTAILIQ